MAQGIHIVAGDGQPDPAAAGHHAHIHGGAVGGDGAVQVGGGFFNAAGDLLAGFAALLPQQHINGKAAAPAHQALGFHGADGGDPLDRKDALQHGIAHGAAFFGGGLLRHFDGNRNLRAIHFRHKGGAHGNGQQRADDQQRHRPQQNGKLVPQHLPQQRFVAGDHPLQQTVGPDGGGFAGEDLARKGRHQRQGDQQAGAQRIGDGKAHIRKELAGQAAGEQNGGKNADGGKGRGGDGSGDLAAAVDRRRGGIVAQLAQTVDIFDGDDAVIHQHADAQRQTGKRDDIEGDARKIHEHHRQQQADGDTERHDNGGAEIPQEQQENDDRQKRAQQQVFQHRADDQIDVLALVAEGGKVQARIALLQFFHGGIKVIAGTGGGGDGGFLDGEQHAVVAVDLGVQLLGIIRQPHRGDIGQADLADLSDIVTEQHPVFQLLQALELFPDLEGGLALLALDIAGGHGKVLRHHHLGDHRLGEDAVQTGLLVGGVPLLAELLLGGIQRLLRLLQLQRRQNELLGKLQLAGLQLGLRLIQLGKGGIQLLLAGPGGFQLLFQLRDAGFQRADGGFQLRDGAVAVLHLIVGSDPLASLLIAQQGFDGCRVAFQFGRV